MGFLEQAVGEEVGGKEKKIYRINEAEDAIVAVSAIELDLPQVNGKAPDHVNIESGELRLYYGNVLKTFEFSPSVKTLWQKGKKQDLEVDANGRAYVLSASVSPFLSKPTDVPADATFFEFTGVTMLPRNGILVAAMYCSDGKKWSTEHIIGVDVQSAKILWKISVDSEKGDTVRGQLTWIDDNNILISFTGKRGSSYSIFDFKKKQIISSGGARAEFQIRNGKVFQIGPKTDDDMEVKEVFHPKKE